MLSRAAEAAAGRVKLLGVTVLTSLAEDDLRAEGIEQTIPEMVRARARIAARAGIAGLVCSSHEIEAARGAAPGLLIVVPGIRPAAGAGAAHGDQKRVATAGQAIANGADYLVVGPSGARRARSGRGVRGRRPRGRSGGVSGASRIVYGVRPVEELVRARPRDVSVVYVADGTRSPEIERVVQTAKERGVTVEFRPRQMVAELAGKGVHQGLVAITGRFRYATVDELLAAAARAGQPPLLVLLDGITDPHNLGAIVRSAEVLGAHGVVVPARGSASVTPGAVKASAGATERVRIAEVANLLRAIDALREQGVRVLGAGAGEGERIDTVDLTGPLALVVGAEGQGDARGGRPPLRRPLPRPAARRGRVAQRLGRRRDRALRSRPPARGGERRSRSAPRADKVPGPEVQEVCRHAFP